MFIILGHKGELPTSQINQLVTWMLEHPCIDASETSERRRSHDDTATSGIPVLPLRYSVVADGKKICSLITVK